MDTRIAEIAAIVADFKWRPLARCLPMHETYVRPAELGDYQAIEWHARWAGRVSGPILIEVAGYLSPDHRNPVGLRIIEIHRDDWLSRARRWLGLRADVQPPRCVTLPFGASR